MIAILTVVWCSGWLDNGLRLAPNCWTLPTIYATGAECLAERDKTFDLPHVALAECRFEVQRPAIGGRRAVAGARGGDR